MVWDDSEPATAGPGAAAAWQARPCVGGGAALWAPWAGPDEDLPAIEAGWNAGGGCGLGSSGAEAGDDSDWVGGVSVLGCCQGDWQ